MLSFWFLAASTLRSAVDEIMRATAYPGINDEKGGEEVPRVFIEGASDGPIPSTESDPEVISLTSTEDFDSEYVFIAGIHPSEPESIDAPAVYLPNTEHIPVDPVQSVQKWVPTRPMDPLAGTEVPTINIVINSAGIVSIREYTHSRGRIETYFTANHTGYFLFSCVITPNPIELVCNISDRAMRVKKDRQKIPKKSSVIWADMYYGILRDDYEWSPLLRCEVFREMSRRRHRPLGEKYTPIVSPEEVRPVRRRRHRSIADFFLIFARIVIPILELLLVAALPILVSAGVARFILLVQAFYNGINGGDLIRKSVRYAYCFFKSTSEHWPWLVWFLDIYHAAVDYDSGKCY